MPGIDWSEPFDEAGEVSVEEGIILIDGPDGVAIALTPGAARTFGERLIAAAEEAQGVAP
jgi:hypothetical protein